MKPYPLVEDLLRPSLGVAMPRARRLDAPHHAGGRAALEDVICAGVVGRL